jgi:PPP family 3-phenylpropionic acid transporter
MAPRDRSGALLAAFYFCWVSAVGTFGPFLASYLATRGFSARATAWTLAALPLIRVLVTPAWTYLADLLRAPTLTLCVASLGSALTFVALTATGTPLALAAALVAYTAFRAPVGALADSVSLDWSARTGGSFGRVRAWGSAGYLVATFAVASSLERLGHGPALALTATLLSLGTLSAWTLPAAPPRPVASLLPSFRRLLRMPTVRRVLAAGVLQQVGLAPYEALFPTWMLHRGGGVWTGTAIASGVACEIVVMVWGRPWITRVGPRRALVVAFGASVVRWLVTALAPWTAVVVFAQSLHGLAFGLYFVAAVQAIDRAAPDDVRASAQGVHYTVAFGLGAALSLALAGALGGVASMRVVFLTAAVASALAAWVASGLDPLPER